ncbi:MAG: efflux RND transporter periplasmic adaptor subunit [Melioribacteraceae bacterium]|nr:efflux RND transporter periplasmic adaptor subunit [Melioribacteraceae bacterium]
MISKKYLKFFLLTLAGMFVAACGSEKTYESKGESVKVNVEKISTLEIPNQYEFSGNVEGSKQVKLSTKLMGEITYLPFETGAAVKKGEVLVKISSKDLKAKKNQVEANMVQAEAALKTTEVNYERLKDLFDKGSASKKEFEDIEMHYTMAKAQVNAVEAMEAELDDVLSYATVTAPFNGFITNKFFEVGDISAPGYPILMVEDLSTLEAVASVSASDINLFEKGMEVKVVLTDLNDLSVSAKVLEVNPSGHPASRQFGVRVELNKEEISSKIKSGMFAKIILETASRKVIAVDESLIVTKGQLKGVYTVNRNNEASLRWLRLGKKYNDKFIVLAGLMAGETVIRDINKVSEGQLVEVVK